MTFIAQDASDGNGSPDSGAAASSKRAGATITVGCASEAQSVTLSPDQWEAVRNGGELIVRGASVPGPDAAAYNVPAIWAFRAGQIFVTAGPGRETGWYGPLHGAHVIEHGD